MRSIYFLIIRRIGLSGEDWYEKIIAGNSHYSRGNRVVYF